MSRRLSRFLILLAALACSAAPALAKVGIRVDLGRQRITVVKNNEPPIVWKISSGRPGYETPTGRFIMQRMDADHFSDEYDQAPMPYAIFFSRGLAIHGATHAGAGPAGLAWLRAAVGGPRPRSLRMGRAIWRRPHRNHRRRDQPRAIAGRRSAAAAQKRQARPAARHLTSRPRSMAFMTITIGSFAGGKRNRAGAPSPRSRGQVWGEGPGRCPPCRRAPRNSLA